MSIIQDMKVNLMCIVSQGILLNLNFMATLFTGSVFLLADRSGVGVGKSPPVGGGGGTNPPLGGGGYQKFYWGEIFLPGEGNLRRSDFEKSLKLKQKWNRSNDYN